MPTVRIGTLDLPDRIERERYFRELSYLELSALFASPLKPAALARWQAAAPAHSLGLVAPWVLTQRKPPRSERQWHHDATVGDFRDSAHGRSALVAFREAVTTLTASHAVFRSPPQFAPSSANRDRLTRFFAEVATAETVGATRVWVPDGLWEPRAAVKFATEIGVVCAIDPLVYDPTAPAEVYEDLEAEALYFQITGLGRTGAIRSEKLEDLAALVEHYERADLTVVFASPARWADARNFQKLLAEQGLLDRPAGADLANDEADDEADDGDLADDEEADEEDDDDDDELEDNDDE
ncbi:MAG TPA: DUF72 domain-containing protein [Kofleriaceae bacterium]|nr:DUF72 domain-containing protein [Kofleriaceae bacterium]